MTDNSEQKIGAYITKSNPPHLGVLMEAAVMSERFDTVYIIYYGGDGTLTSSDWVATIKSVVEKISDRYKVISTPFNFDTIQKVPEYIKKLGVTQLVTSSNKVLMQCAIHEIPCARVRKAPYFYDVFQQKAFGKGMILTNLKKRFGTK